MIEFLYFEFLSYTVLIFVFGVGFGFGYNYMILGENNRIKKKDLKELKEGDL